MAMIAKLLNDNFILACDSYKFSHYKQLPKGVCYMHSSVVPRKPNKHTKEIVVGGVTYTAKYLAAVRITHADIDEAVIEASEQGYEINEAAWRDIVDNHDGRLPIRVEALEDGTVVQPNTAVLTIVNTDPAFAWLPSYVETVVQRIIWKFSTVASICRSEYKLLMCYAVKTGADPFMVQYLNHNFGDRGADSDEAAAWAGIAHAMVFSGSDHSRANINIKKLYNTRKPYTASVDATEHSTMCANSDAKTKNDFRAAVMLVEQLEEKVRRLKNGTLVGLPIVSGVIDTYNAYRFITEYLGGPELKPRIEAAGKAGGKLVLRPDSGIPEVEVPKILQLAGEAFGMSVNKLGYKELVPYIGVLQGDGINQESIIRILEVVCDIEKWSLASFLFGQGGGLVHEAGRDEFSFSQKATAMSFNRDASVNADWISLLKEPITDSKKKSLSGFIINVRDTDGTIRSIDRRNWYGEPIIRNVVFEDGDHFMNEVDAFDGVRERARAGINAETFALAA
jgi:nicotinamide phosphoribosyltransferase